MDQILKQNSFTKIAILVALLLVAVFMYKKWQSRHEHMYDMPYSEIQVAGEQMEILEQHGEVAQDADTTNMHNTAPITFKTGGKELLPMDLLPKSQISNDFDVVQGETNEMSARNFLVTSNNFGIDTVGSSNKNPNLQLRSDPFIPNNMNTGPWNQSTIQPNLYQRKFDLGE
jgi:hypothetical protein